LKHNVLSIVYQSNVHEFAPRSC